MKTNAIVCDGCEKPINATAGYTSFAPLRGGLDLVVRDDKKELARSAVREEVHFCAPDCLKNWVGKTVAVALGAANKAPAATAPGTTPKAA